MADDDGTARGASRPDRPDHPDRPVAIALAGPTAAGKTRLALAVAERIPAEIISMDSRQVYRGMDIGTAKASRAERAAVPHHGLDLIDPGQRYSAGQFARDARRWIDEIRARGRTPLLVGGTGFFLRALTDPLFEEPEMDPARRKRLGRILDRRSDEELGRWLAALDPEAVRRFGGGGSGGGGGGRQRVLRALEVALLTGRPLGWWHEHRPGPPPLGLRTFVLDLPREQLDARIDLRVTGMLEAGLVEEVRGLLARGYAPDAPGMTATGYAEVAAHLRAGVPLEEAADGIRRATRRYARRQLTWLRHQLTAGAVWLDGSRPLEELVEEVVEGWGKG